MKRELKAEGGRPGLSGGGLLVSMKRELKGIPKPPKPGFCDRPGINEKRIESPGREDSGAVRIRYPVSMKRELKEPVLRPSSEPLGYCINEKRIERSSFKSCRELAYRRLISMKRGLKEVYSWGCLDAFLDQLQ